MFLISVVVGAVRVQLIVLMLCRLQQLAKAFPKGGAPCESDHECSLAGRCRASRCACDAAWTGANCSVLHLVPAAPYHHYRNTSGATSWGGSVIFAEGLWHMFVSQMAPRATLNHWKSASFIAHCIASAPTGPYTLHSRALAGYGHNPSVHRAPDGTYLLYYIRRHTSQISLASAPSIYGPWGDCLRTCLKGHRITNPGPHVFRNGSVALFYRYGQVQSLQLGLAFAHSWEGPYHTIKEPLFVEQGEDPFVWRNSHGYWHMLFHGCRDPYLRNVGSWCVSFGGWLAQGPYCGRHAFSENLVDWQFSWPAAYNATVTYRNGASQTFLRRERPQILFIDGAPAYLITGVQRRIDSKSGYSYTLIQPINT